jgi:4-hydroxyacetophenone monooxygenase
MHWYRFWLFWTSTDGLLPAAIVDDDWESEGSSVSAANDQLRQMFTMTLKAQYEDRPDLFEKILPKYPVAAKRFLLDNGSWPEALKRDNVELITDGIKEITKDGVVTVAGRLIEADVIIYGTGFHASQFLMPMEIKGSKGVTLAKQWDGDARAYLGITVPNFPNFFMLYGPNTNIVVNGSIIYFSECEVQYVMGCLRMLVQDGRRAMVCRQDVHDAYNVRIDEANSKRAWGASDVNSWYKNDKGRVSQNWPFNLLDYWQQTREPDPADYVFL